MAEEAGIVAAGNAPLLHAAAAGRLAEARALIEAGADVDAADGGWTPLRRAAEAGHASVVRALLDAGADANARYGHDETPLHRAAGHGHAAVVRALIAAGADVNAKDGRVRTALHHAVRAAHGGLAGPCGAARVLLDAGADMLAKDYDGMTALHDASVHDTATGGRSLCYLLSRLPQGTKLDDLVSSIDETPLHMACYSRSKRHLAGIKALLAHGATSDAEFGRTPAAIARDHGKTYVLDLFERHKRTPFTIDDVPEAFIPLLTEDPLWKIDQIVAMWGTRKWGSGATTGARAGARTGAGATARVGADHGDHGIDVTVGRPATAAPGAAAAPDAPAAVDDDTSGDSVDAEPQLAPAPYNAGLPQKVVCWQSMPRNVVALVTELSVDITVAE